MKSDEPDRNDAQPPTPSRRASCTCGEISVATQGDPIRISICHCLECQRRTGSAFGAQAWFREHHVKTGGESRQYTRITDSGNRITFRFCSHCGSTVHYRLEEWPGVIAVALGAFADPEFPAPRVSVYEARKHRWVGLPADIERLD